MSSLNGLLIMSTITTMMSLGSGAQQTQPVQFAKAVIEQAIRVAEKNRTPAGFVLTKEDLCRRVQLLQAPSRDATTQIAFADVKRSLGGTVTEEDGVLVYRTANANTRLTAALQHRFPQFPALSGTKAYFGSVLNGWMKSTLPGNRGFAFDVASSLSEEEGTLEGSSNLSIEQIANRIARFKSGAVWIAVDSDRVGSDPEAEMSLRAYPYEIVPVISLPSCEAKKME